MSANWICFGQFRSRITPGGEFWHFGRQAYGPTPYAAFHALVIANCKSDVEMTGKPHCRRVS